MYDNGEPKVLVPPSFREKITRVFEYHARNKLDLIAKMTREVTWPGMLEDLWFKTQYGEFGQIGRAHV